MSNEPQRPYYDPAIAQAERVKRAEQLISEVKRVFNFGKCKVIENQPAKKP